MPFTHAIFFSFILYIFLFILASFFLGGLFHSTAHAVCTYAMKNGPSSESGLFFSQQLSLVCLLRLSWWIKKPLTLTVVFIFIFIQSCIHILSGRLFFSLAWTLNCPSSSSTHPFSVCSPCECIYQRNNHPRWKIKD